MPRLTKRVIVPKSKLPSKTKQSFKDEADINKITERYIPGRNTVGDPRATRQPHFGDFTYVDFMEMHNSIADINQRFHQLPARIRSRFDGDPAQVVRFVEKPQNHDDAVKMGLLPPKDRQEAVRLGLLERGKVEQIDAFRAQDRARKAKVDTLDNERAVLHENERSSVLEDDEANPRKTPKNPN